MAQNRSNIRWWILGISVGFSFIGLLVLLFGGEVNGEEFSPDDFSRRSFSYNVMPFFKVCLRGIEYQDRTPVFEQTLLSDGYLGEIAKKLDGSKQWHLVYDSASDPKSPDFDAKLLVRFLELKNTQFESIWMKWNDDYPELAAKFWPVVADMARNNLYVELTDIMARAVSLTEHDILDFENFIDQHASSAFCRLADRLKNDGDFMDALEQYKKSLDLMPSKRAALGKRDCLQMLDKADASGDGVQAEFDAE